MFNALVRNPGEDVSSFEARYDKHLKALEESEGIRKKQKELVSSFLAALGGEIAERLEILYMRGLPGTFQELRQDALHVEEVISDSKKAMDVAEQRNLDAATKGDFVAMVNSGRRPGNGDAKADPLMASIKRQGEKYEELMKAQAEFFQKQENIRQKQVDMLHSMLQELKKKPSSSGPEDGRRTRVDGRIGQELFCTYCNRRYHTRSQCRKLRSHQDRINAAFVWENGASAAVGDNEQKPPHRPGGVRQRKSRKEYRQGLHKASRRSTKRHRRQKDSSR